MENIDNLIINRLGEHKRKVDFIEKNINSRRENHFSLRRYSYLILSAAACVAIILAISPMLFKSNSVSDLTLTPPSFAEYRGSSLNKIEFLLNNEQYMDALSTVDFELVELDKDIEFLYSAEMSEEEKIFSISLYNEEKEELMWSKIYLLVKLNREDDLRVSCQNYLKNSDFKKYDSEVDMILKKIQ